MLGNANHDLILEVDKGPLPGETIRAHASHQKLGGKVNSINLNINNLKGLN